MRTVDSFNDLCELEDLGLGFDKSGTVNAIAIVAYCDGITKQEASNKIFGVSDKGEDIEEFMKPYFNSVFRSPFFIETLAESQKTKGVWTKIKKLLTRK